MISYGRLDPAQTVFLTAVPLKTEVYFLLVVFASQCVHSSFHSASCFDAAQLNHITEHMLVI